MAELDASYPAFSLAVESLCRKYSRTREAGVVLRQTFDGLVLALELAMRVSMRSTSWMPSVGDTVDQLSSSVIVRPGERDKALDFLSRWVRDMAGDEVKICDPYFGIEDIDLIRLIQDAKPECKIQILTSQQRHSNAGQPWDDLYRSSWYRLSDQEPPNTEIIAAGTIGDGALPIHDRWWLSGDSGIRVGTSFNGLGTRESELSLLTRQESTTRTAEIDRYLERRVREHAGKRVTYSLFTL